MNILLISTHLNIGGIPVYIVSLAGQLKKRGHKVMVATSGGSLTSQLRLKNIQHYKLNLNTKSELSPKLALAILQLLPLIKLKKIDIIHAHTRVSQVVAFWLSKLKGTAVA